MGQRSIRFPDELEARLVAAAGADGRTFSNFVVRAAEFALSYGAVSKVETSEAEKFAMVSSLAAHQAALPSVSSAIEHEVVGGNAELDGPAPPKIAKRHWA